MISMVARIFGGCLSLLLLLPAPVYAQSGDGPGALEEVIVTAQRREESLQDVPAAVSALSAETLEQQSISNVIDLDNAIPNLVISENTGTSAGARIYLRGIGEDESRATVEPAVSLYVDGVYIGRQIGALFEMLDLERVEVLRGPQGTLYGRNSNAGSIKLISKRPDPSAGTRFSLEPTTGSDDLRGVKFKGNIPLTKVSALRISALRKTRDGFFGAQDGRNLGKLDLKALRVTGYCEQENWDASLILEAFRNDSDPRPANVSEEDDKGAFTDITGNVYSIENMRQRLVDGTFVANPTVGSPHTSTVDQNAFSLVVNYQLNPSYLLSSITSRRTMEDDLDSWILGAYQQQTDQDQFSQEFQLTSQWDGPFNYVAGAFFFNEEIDFPYVFFAPGLLKVETDARALYAQGSYDFTAQSRLTAGVRYTDEEKDFSGYFRGFGGPPPRRDEKADWQNTSVKLAYSHDLWDNVTSYVSYATGFRSGAWSPDAFGAPFLPVDDETVRTVEFGVRSEWLDNRLRANATVFFNDYEDLQLSGTTPSGFTRFNAGDVEISGVEFEFTALLTRSLELNFVASALDAEYKELSFDAAVAMLNLGTQDVAGRCSTVTAEDGTSTFTCTTPNNAATAPAARGGPFLSDADRTRYDELIAEYAAAYETALGDTDDAAFKTTTDPLLLEEAAFLATARDNAVSVAEGVDLKGVPEFSATLGLAYNTVLPGGLQVRFSGDLAYEDDFYNLLGAQYSHSEVGEKAILNLRFSLGHPRDNWQFSIWGKNVTDELYYPASVYSAATDSNSVYAADPATWGMDFKVMF